MQNIVHRSASRAVSLLFLLAVAATAGCESDTPPVAPDPAAFGSAPAHAEANAWIAKLRSKLAPFHRIDVADAAGYDTDLTGCMVDPVRGGMGHHYANLELLDGQVDALAPEALLYEPQRNGRMRLVGVEYVVPVAAWAGASPPELHGQVFTVNEAFGVWALHAWVWKHNPEGMFADWNPDVNCDFAS
jgi:hypothetical protein